MARNPRNPTNQIQVELKLLQDDNVRLLKEFGDKWAEGATALGRDIQSLMGQRSGSLPAVQAGGESASTVKKTAESMEGGLSAPQLHARQVAAQQAINPANATVLPSAAASAAMANMARPAATPPVTPGMLRRAKSSMGGALKAMFPADSADMYGSMVGSMFGGENSTMAMLLGGMAGRALGGGKQNMKGTAGIAAAGGLLALTQQNVGFGGFPLGMGNFNYDAQSYGNAFGLSNQSSAPGFLQPLVGSYGSEAWKATQQAQIEASRRGRRTIGEIPYVGGAIGHALPFGLGDALGAVGFNDPRYNSKQSREAMALTTAYGWGNPDQPYSAAMQDTMLDYMGKMSRQYPGIPQEAMMQAMEPVRFGTGTFEGATTAIGAMAEAARAANMNLEVFAEKAGAAAMALHQQQGTPYQQALKDVSAFSTATGLPPEMAQGFMTDTGGYLEMGRTGKGAYETFYGQGANVGKMRGQLSMIGELAKPEFWQSIKNDPKALEAAKDQLHWWYTADPSFLGGMSPPDFLAMMMRGKDPVSKAAGVTHILGAQGTDNMAVGLKIAGESKEMINTYRQTINDKNGLDADEIENLKKRGHGAMAAYIEKQGMFEKGDKPKQRRADAKALGQWIIGKDARTGKGVKDAQKVTLDIKAPYDQIFTEMIQKHKDKARRNTDPKAKASRGGDGHAWYDPRGNHAGPGEAWDDTKDKVGDAWGGVKGLFDGGEGGNDSIGAKDPNGAW